MTPTPSILLRIPIELPNDLLEELDCGQNGTQYAAFYHDLRSDRVFRTNGMSVNLCAEGWLFEALMFLNSASSTGFNC